MTLNVSGLRIAIGADGQLDLRINGRLTAAQADALIAHLSNLRAELDPPVPMKPRTDVEIELTTDPALALQEDLADQTLMVTFRHVGLGWCAFEFTRPAAAELRDELARFAGNLPPPASARDAGGTAH